MLLVPRFVFIEGTNTKGSTMRLPLSIAAVLLAALALASPVVLTGTAHADASTVQISLKNDPWEP